MAVPLAAIARRAALGLAKRVASQTARSATSDDKRPVLIVLAVLFMLLPSTVTVPVILVMTVAAHKSTSSAECGPGAGAGGPLVVGNDADQAAGSGPTGTTLDDEQLGNAKIIWKVAQDLKMGDQAAVIGLATALQESGLRNLPGGDRDSIGLFQQRPSTGWGTAKEIGNPQLSAMAFYGQASHTANPGLADIGGWEKLPVTVAAQKVQASAFPDAYAKHEASARQLVASFNAGGHDPNAQPDLAVAAGATGPGGAGCGPAASGTVSGQCRPTDMPAERGLTPDALLVLRCAKAQFPQLATIGGIGDRPANVDDDHQTGKAVDLMVPGRCDPLGEQIKQWAYDNRAQLGVKYVIWCDKIWSVARDAEGWRPYSNPSGGDDTLQHRDHVHVSVMGNAAQPAAPAGAANGPVVLPIPRGAFTMGAEFGKAGSWSSGHHQGTDFLCRPGTPLLSITAGKVQSVSHDSDGGPYGNSTLISGVDGGTPISFRYSHMNAPPQVKTGDTVRPGQQIGQCGWTGRVIPKAPSAAHLDLEFRLNGTLADGEKWLNGHGQQTRTNP